MKVKNPGGVGDIGARVTHSVAQAIPTTTVTTLAFDTERWDTASFHDVAVNNSRLTIPAAGKYLATLNVEFTASAIGARAIYVFLNGATYIAKQTEGGPDGVNNDVLVAVMVYDLAAGDYIEARCYQTSGGALSVAKLNAVSPEFSIQRVG